MKLVVVLADGASSMSTPDSSRVMPSITDTLEDDESDGDVSGRTGVVR